MDFTLLTASPFGIGILIIALVVGFKLDGFMKQRREKQQNNYFKR